MRVLVSTAKALLFKILILVLEKHWRFSNKTSHFIPR